MKQESLSWIPVRKGKRYCAPACGHGCTVQMHSLALSAAKAVARKMGKGWKAWVHENMGWFGTVISPCGRIQVSLPYRQGAEFHAEVCSADRARRQLAYACALTPRGAVRVAVGAAKAKAARWAVDVEGL